MTRDYTNPDENNRPTLQEQVGDNSIERGIPTELNVRKKKTVMNIVLFGIGLFLAALIVFKIWGFFSNDNAEAVAPKVEENVVTKGNKNFKADKDEIETIPEEPVAASEPENKQASAVEITPSPAPGDLTPPAPSEPVEPPKDERLDASLTPSGVESMNGVGASLTEGNSSSTGSSSFDGSSSLTAASGSGGGNRLTERLQSGVYRAGVAENRGDTTYLLARGTGIPCVTTTKIVTTHPGLTRCQVEKDVYSANGKTLLVERGATIIGEQTAALTHGQARVFALWSELETPAGVRVKLDSPGGDPLGASGHPAKVNYHFWQRFGGAIMISMINDIGTGLNNRQNRASGNNNNITYENTSDAAQEMATEALKNSINIPPTGFVNQGTQIMVFVARDIDFSDVYENITVNNAYAGY